MSKTTMDGIYNEVAQARVEGRKPRLSAGVVKEINLFLKECAQ
jgi:hypothetical protein